LGAASITLTFEDHSSRLAAELFCDEDAAAQLTMVRAIAYSGLHNLV